MKEIKISDYMNKDQLEMLNQIASEGNQETKEMISFLKNVISQESKSFTLYMARETGCLETGQPEFGCPNGFGSGYYGDNWNENGCELVGIIAYGCLDAGLYNPGVVENPEPCIFPMLIE